MHPASDSRLGHEHDTQKRRTIGREIRFCEGVQNLRDTEKATSGKVVILFFLVLCTRRDEGGGFGLFHQNGWIAMEETFLMGHVSLSVAESLCQIFVRFTSSTSCMRLHAIARFCIFVAPYTCACGARFTQRTTWVLGDRRSRR